jgi:glucose-1-phosphate thymidylyltransferase
MATTQRDTMPQEVIGLFPAAGQASRISPLPMSKELFPIGFRAQADGSLRPKVVSHYLLDKMHQAGIRKVYMLLRPGKWDIPAYFGDGSLMSLDLAYVVVSRLHGVPYTLDHAYPFVKKAICALGYPDILFQPEDTYTRLLQKLTSTTADVVINAVPFAQAHKGGMLSFDATGAVSAIVEKPSSSESRYSWCAAVWQPTFTEFLHEFVQKAEHQAQRTGHRQEIPIGDAIHAAIAAGLRVEAEFFDTDGYLDIGTPADLIKAVRFYAELSIQN